MKYTLSYPTMAITRSMSRALREQQNARSTSRVKSVQITKNSKPKVSSNHINIPKFTEDEIHAILPTLGLKLRSLDIWYTFIDNHQQFMEGKTKVDNFKEELKKYDLSLQQRLQIYNYDCFEKYDSLGKHMLRQILNIPSLV